MDKVYREVETESEKNRNKVTGAMTSLRQLIDQQEQILLEKIKTKEKEEKENIESYKRELQGEQQNLIKQVFNFVVARRDRTSKKLLSARKPFEDYLNRIETRLTELKPWTRPKLDIIGFEKIQEIETQIRNFRLDSMIKHENPELAQKLNNHRNQPIWNLSNSGLNDLDMELVGMELTMNRVSSTRSMNM